MSNPTAPDLVTPDLVTLGASTPDPRAIPPGTQRGTSHVPETEHILQFFAFEHLPLGLQEVSRPFGELAVKIVETLPRNPERTAALRKLLEAKDAAVRTLMAK